MTDDTGERLNKYLARRGVASRRGADELIASGRVTVNGVLATQLGARLDPRTDVVRVDGEVVGHVEKPVTIVLHKPPNVLTTVSDPLGRPTVMDLVNLPQRLFPVGRLDFASEGLVIMTNDGDLTQHLLHPRYEHEREYRVRVSGTPSEQDLETWRTGVHLEDGRTAPARVTVESSSGGHTWLRIAITEGRNRQIRRMVEALHHRVHRLIRIRFGPLELADLPSGRWRRLTDGEVAALVSTTSARRPDESRPAPKYKAGWARPKVRHAFRGRPTARTGGRGRSSRARGGRPD